MRVRQDGDSRGVGEPPRLSVQVLCLVPPGCSRLLPIHVYVLSLKEKNNNICAVLGSPERVSKKEGGIPIAGGGGGRRGRRVPLYSVLQENFVA